MIKTVIKIKIFMILQQTKGKKLAFLCSMHTYLYIFKILPDFFQDEQVLIFKSSLLNSFLLKIIFCFLLLRSSAEAGMLLLLENLLLPLK